MTVHGPPLPNEPSQGTEQPLMDPRPLDLRVTDALSYLDAVKAQFKDEPGVYGRFLDIMKDFKLEM